MLLSCSPSGVENQLRRLDDALAASSSYASARENRIRAAEEQVKTAAGNPQALYNAYSKLYALCCDYQFNKALSAAEGMEKSAHECGLATLVNLSLLQKGMLWCRAGYFVECSGLISSVDTSSFTTDGERFLWYELNKNFYQDFREFIHPGVGGELDEKAGWYRGKLIEYLPEGDVRHDMTLMEELVYQHNFNGAREVGDKRLNSLEKESHDYAMAAYWMGVLYEQAGVEDLSLDWYINSAICDATLATKDNASLQCVALELLHSDISRAFRYTQLSLDDALFYNSRLRPLQIARNLPSIEREYEQMTRRDIRTRTVLLFVLTILLGAAIALLLRMLYYQRKLHSTVEQLKEAGEAKEEFLALFLSQSSGYLDKLRHFLKLSQMESELKKFYSAFDDSFTRLYPSFVEDFNALLEPSARVELKKGEKLNTQLRIFALIRLGITQSSQIASLLRYSPNTIYNYRAQMKAAALDGKEDFEQKVRSIGR